MPNIAIILKDEITRLARKELRSELEGIKKASAQYRSQIAALKRQVVTLEKQVARIGKKEPKKMTVESEGEAAAKFRFSAKRFATQRQKLGVSAGTMGTLIGVSAQTIYNWETGKSRPRQQQLAAIAAVRGMGKRRFKELAQAEKVE